MIAQGRIWNLADTIAEDLGHEGCWNGDPGYNSIYLGDVK